MQKMWTSANAFYESVDVLKSVQAFSATQASDKRRIWRTFRGSFWVRHCRAGRSRARWVTSVMLGRSMVMARTSGCRLPAQCSGSLRGSSDVISTIAHSQTRIGSYVLHNQCCLERGRPTVITQYRRCIILLLASCHLIFHRPAESLRPPMQHRSLRCASAMP